MGALAVAAALSAGVGVRAAAGAAPRLPLFAGCSSSAPTLRPRSILVACGDGNFFTTGLTWSRWGITDAVAAGTGHQNDCTPDCARGRFRLYPVDVRLWRPETCVDGRREFTRFSYRFVGNKPAGVVRGDTLKSPFYRGAGCP